MTNNLEQLQNLLSSMRQLSPEEINAAASLVRSLSFDEDKDYGFCMIAEHLVNTGGTDDLDKAIEFALKSTDIWGRHSTLRMIVERLMKLRDKNGVFRLISQIENDASAIQANEDLLPSQKASAWAAVAELYSHQGSYDRAKIARAKAVELAMASQHNHGNRQDISDSQALLRHIVGGLVAEYLFVSALQIVEQTNWHDKDAWVDALKRLISANPHQEQR